jgi:hypothetical protein
MKTSRPCLALLILLALLAGLPARADPALCESAAHRAAQETGVPVAVLLAISLAETGREQGGRLRPWPWSGNAEGQGHWFDSRAQALAWAQGLLARGQPLFDLGCFQINWRWHGTHFLGPEDLLDPLASARYAARFLQSLQDELGDWTAAAGAYHSRTPENAARYSARFAQILAGLGTPVVPAPVGETPRENTFPLLAGAASGASLVPAGLPALRPLFEALP